MIRTNFHKICLRLAFVSKENQIKLPILNVINLMGQVFGNSLLLGVGQIDPQSWHAPPTPPTGTLVEGEGRKIKATFCALKCKNQTTH